MKRRKFLKKNLLILFALSSSYLTSSCGFTPPSVPVCTELSLNRGYCVDTIKDIEYEVSDEKPFKNKEGKMETWWDMRPKMIYLPADSWKEIKTFIIKVCKRTGKCNTNITDWQRTIDRVDKKIVK